MVFEGLWRSLKVFDGFLVFQGVWCFFWRCQGFWWLFKVYDDFWRFMMVFESFWWGIQINPRTLYMLIEHKYSIYPSKTIFLLPLFDLCGGRRNIPTTFLFFGQHPSNSSIQILHPPKNILSTLGSQYIPKLSNNENLKTARSLRHLRRLRVRLLRRLLLGFAFARAGPQKPRGDRPLGWAYPLNKHSYGKSRLLIGKNHL